MAEAPKNQKSQIVTIPNLLSFFRLLLIPVIAWLYCCQANYPLTALVLALSGATDVADGFIARHFNMISDLGKVLDPVADKLTQVTALACLLTRFKAVWWVIGMMVIKETVMTVMGILVIRRTRGVYSAAWHGKLATVLLYGIIFAHIVWYDIPETASILLAAAGTAGILLSLVLYTIANLRRIRGK